MDILKNISIIFISIALLISNIANASMPCCIIDMQNSQMQSDNLDSDTAPCHKKSDNDQQDSQGFNSCDCQHCFKIVQLTPKLSSNIELLSREIILFDQSIYSIHPDSIFQPPKIIS